MTLTASEFLEQWFEMVGVLPPKHGCEPPPPPPKPLEQRISELEARIARLEGRGLWPDYVPPPARGVRE